MTESGRPRRPSLALSVRAALALVLGVGLLLGWWVAARRQHAAVLAIQARDRYAITYDDGSILEQEDGFRGLAPRLSRRAPAWWPLAWLESALGRDSCRTVVGVSLGGDSMYAPPLAREDVIPTLLRLPHLRTLDLQTSGLTDAEVAQLARLASLEELTLCSNTHSELTDAGLRSLGRLRGLKQLSVRGDFTDDELVALRDFDRLEDLTLMTTTSRLEGPPPSRLTGRGLAHAASLPRLRELAVESGRLDAAGLEAIGRLRHLEGLAITGGTYGDADLRPLARLLGLRGLLLQDTPIDGTGFEALGGLDKLKLVMIRGCPNLRDAVIPPLARLPALQTVALWNGGLTVAGVEGLRAAPGLTSLEIRPLNPADRFRLRRALPTCRVLGQ